jgi:hypothetical protein
VHDPAEDGKHVVGFAAVMKGYLMLMLRDENGHFGRDPVPSCTMRFSRQCRVSSTRSVETGPVRPLANNSLISASVHCAHRRTPGRHSA